MTRIVLSVWIFVGSLAAVLSAGSLISHILTAYPADHFRTFGTTIPSISETHARWLPHAPAALGASALLSLIVAIYFWRSGRSREIKAFAVTFVAAVNYFLALFCVMALVVAYFLLPKVANAA
ncbi:hypothetical protein [Lysobacter sp. Root494]|uniref:hypothetical protein n=1 Tax=Lysobacter sp. Root494 TaxID=1736549 RepID=UPI0006F65662|nr:hypothetical protein [Lysobacter sp. Root494]KQY48646.1 hypothetical protein ASD14_15525 [Lysobacter sp. Root494]